MPIYEYQCPSCGHDFEYMQKISAPSPACPSCGAEVRKKVSQTSFQLKGGGWYVTDYKPASDGAKAEAKATNEAKPAEAPADKPADLPKADSKPADKPAASEPKADKPAA